MTSWAHSTSYVVNTMNFKNHNTIFESLDLLTTRDSVNKYLISVFCTGNNLESGLEKVKITPHSPPAVFFCNHSKYLYLIIIDFSRLFCCGS